MDIKRKNYFEIIFVASMFISFALFLASLIRSGHDSYQWKVFFKDFSDFQADFVNVVGYSGQRDPYNCLYYTGLFEKAYPPLAYVLMYLVSRLVNMDEYYSNNCFLNMWMEPRILMVIITSTAVGLIALFESVRKTLNGSYIMKLCVSAAVLLSAPVMFTIERGNSVLLVASLLMIYVFNYDSKNKISKEIALLCLAVAASLKVSPALFGVLLIYKKDWKAVARAVVYGVVLFFGPFLLLKGGFANVPLMLENIRLNNEFYSNKSCFTLARVLVQYGMEPTDRLYMVAGIINKLICIIMVICASKFRRKSDVIMVLCVVMIVFPEHAGYYNLLFTIPAIVMLLNEQSRRAYDLLALLSIISYMHIYRFKLDGSFIDYHTSVLLLMAYCIIITVVEVFYIRNCRRNCNRTKSCMKDSTSC